MRVRSAAVAVEMATARQVLRGDPASCGRELRTTAEAEAYVASMCFKHGPPVLVGVELEWLLHAPDNPTASITRDRLTAALGPHAPTSLDPSSPALPLPAGSTVTVEPGGQVELATPPRPGIGALTEAVRRDAAVLHRLLAEVGLVALPRSADPVRPPTRILDLPRYTAMERYFDRIGSYGRSGMCSTASVQVCLDAGQAAGVAARWAAVHAIGPVLLAAFANSPQLHGRSTGWKSSRMACWLRADPARTAPPTIGEIDGPDPAAAWAQRVVHSPVMLRRAGTSWDVRGRVTFADWIAGALPGRPTLDDLHYHISTLFPPVRPRGYLEIRYIDAQAGRGWALPLAVLVALTSRDDVVDQVRQICAPTYGRWVSAARQGLDDRVIARAARGVFELACAVLPELNAPGWLVDDLVWMTERRILRARCPADEPVCGGTPSTAGLVSGPAVTPLEGAPL